MRILHLVKTSGGADWAVRLARELVRAGMEVHVAVPFGGSRIDTYRELGAELHEQHYSLRPTELIRWGRRLRRTVREVQPDIIHSWFAQTTFYARTFLRHTKIPRVFQVMGPLHLESAAYRYADVLSANSDDSWVSTSQYIYDLYRGAGVARAQLALAYIPTDIDAYRPTEKGYLRAKLGIPSTKRIIGMVAHIYPPHRMLLTRRGVKGHEDLIDAFAVLQRRREDLVLVIVGKAWENHTAYEQRIRDYARHRCGDDVLFAGFVEDVRDAFADFDVFVHPARSENLGGVFESLLLGVPTVGSNVGGIPEAVKHGETGLLVDPTDHHLMADRIEELLDDPDRANTLAQRGKRHIREVMDLQRSVQSVTELYHQLMRGRK